MPQAQLNPETALEAEVAALLARAGRAAGALTLRPCPTGGNNRVYAVETDSGPVLAKRYFTSPADPRDRLKAEWDFLGYAVNAGVGCVPRPLACDAGARLALYEFLEGRPLTESEIGPSEIAAAADFILALNAPEARVNAAHIGAASEGCFSIAAQFALIGRRVARLQAIEPEGSTGREAATLAGEIARVWEDLRNSTEAALSRRGIGLDGELPPESRVLSPSDVGFHNALRRPDGTLAFFDFEYAGWDDPAKLVADFLYQPEFPPEVGEGETFAARVLEGLGCDSGVRERARILRPLFALKWCCIMLNPFLGDGPERRRFADRERGGESYKSSRLAKAAARLRQVAGEAAP